MRNSRTSVQPNVYANETPGTTDGARSRPPSRSANQPPTRLLRIPSEGRHAGSLPARWLEVDGDETLGPAALGDELADGDDDIAAALDDERADGDDALAPVALGEELAAADEDEAFESALGAELAAADVDASFAAGAADAADEELGALEDDELDGEDDELGVADDELEGDDELEDDELEALADDELEADDELGALSETSPALPARPAASVFALPTSAERPLVRFSESAVAADDAGVLGASVFDASLTSAEASTGTPAGGVSASPLVRNPLAGVRRPLFVLRFFGVPPLPPPPPGPFGFPPPPFVTPAPARQCRACSGPTSGEAARPSPL
jgi:hypothetical protein